MKVLVTGAAGFIGHHVVEHFLQNTDWDLVLIDRLDISGNLNRLAEIGAAKNPRVKFFFHDLRAPFNELMIKQIGHVDYFVHMAAGSHVDRSIEAPMEFPSLIKLMEHGLWDTIYHEHFSYLSFTTVHEIFLKHGLQIFDVQELPTHGGSLRIFARHAENEYWFLTDAYFRMLETERPTRHLGHYTYFPERVKQSKRDILEWFTYEKNCGKTIAGFGAPGKGNTLLNYCGIRRDFLEFVVDESPHKQGLFLPGSRIPILHPAAIKEERPDYVIIMPWNWTEEIQAKLSYIGEWGGKCVVLLPEPRVL